MTAPEKDVFMRYREPYTVFKRTMKSGRVVWYYQTYDPEGNSTSARSTGQITKSVARAYCLKLLKEDRLIPNIRGRMTFEEYSKNWWDWKKCEYVAYRKSRRDLSQSYVKSSKAFMVRELVPAFGKKRLKDITPLI